ncbi:MAG TPA: hypothetical protein PKY77_00945 [Phycisphaerae bacterium]|nr:hypothetical protein [Phycisphaerae bacterium]HRY67578.1 hypothetical protein [Phycisphaerae bacterium]HSA24965.1 hypothetical protein [Phycisphaerae bacterium]
MVGNKINGFWSSTGALSAGLALVAVLWPAPSVLSVQEFSEPVTRVEEDWVLVLNEPDDAITSPQFHTVMSPVGNLEGSYAQVLWNYREVPNFVAGGLQLQGWNGEQMVNSKTVRVTPLSTTAETIRWTQVLEIVEGELFFDIVNGQSTTWGWFGRDMRLQQAGTASDLNAYNAQVSVNNSCITYGSNRVTQLVINEVRWYGQSGLLYTDSTPKVISAVSEVE